MTYSHHHGHGHTPELEHKQNENKGHDSKTLFRARAAFFRTCFEHATLWGGLIDMVFGLEAAFLLSPWGWAGGVMLGIIWGQLDSHAHKLADSANDEVRNQDIDKLIKIHGYTEEDIHNTVIDPFDFVAVKGHVYDEGTINWAVWLYLEYLAMAATLKDNHTILSLVASIFACIPGLSSLKDASLLLADAPFPSLEKLAILCTGLYIGNKCTDAEERTIMNQVKRYTFWKQHHHLLSNQEAKVEKPDFLARTWSRLPSLRFWESKREPITTPLMELKVTDYGSRSFTERKNPAPAASFWTREPAKPTTKSGLHQRRQSMSAMGRGYGI